MNIQTHSIANRESVQKRVDDLNHRSAETKGRLAKTLKLLWNPERILKKVTINGDFLRLRDSFPQFAEVIDYFENSIISFSKLNLPFDIAPILLVGDAGLGKTFFAKELAKALELAFYEISLATTTASFTLSGSNIQWAEGSPGFIANTLAESLVANPIVLLDEIDKVSISNKYNPMNVFYDLLEGHSAKNFRDEALELALDASKINWIATANYPRQIPEPILSRLRIFVVQNPSPTDMPIVVRSIYRQIRSNKVYGKLLADEIDNEILQSLSRLTPRKVKLALEEAAFKAIRHDRRNILSQDLPLIQKEKNRVGFI